MPRSVLDEEALARAGGRSGVGAGVGVGFAFAVLEEIVASEPPLMLVGPLESQVIDFAQCVALFALNVPDETVVALACDKNLALETINVLDGVLKDTLKRGSLRGGLLKTRPAAALGSPRKANQAELHRFHCDGSNTCRISENIPSFCFLSPQTC